MTRHRVSRRIRHVIAADMAAWDELGSDIVVRPLPSAARATSAEFAAELRRGRAKLMHRQGREGGA